MPKQSLPRRQSVTNIFVDFEFDPWKSENNKAKHGIDFVEAQALWKSEIVLLPAKDALEKRYLVIGTISSAIGLRLSPIVEERFGLLVLGNPPRLRLGRMKRSQAKPTTAENLEDKFDRGEEVLDYFEVTKARVINPRSKGSVVKTKFRYPAKRNSDRRAAVREKL